MHNAVFGNPVTEGQSNIGPHFTDLLQKQPRHYLRLFVL